MELDRWVREGAFRKLVGRRRPPLRDCMRDSAMLADTSRAWAINDAVLATARRNKVFQGGTVHGWHVVALDASEVIRTPARGCPACPGYTHKDGRAECVHRLCTLQMVARPEPPDEEGSRRRGRAGGRPPAVCGMEAQRPGEDEVGAARRLLRRIVQRHGHFCDVVTVDGAYAEAPFLNEVRALGLQAVVRLKDERCHGVQDAVGLRRNEPHQAMFATWIGPKHVEVTLWDTPDLTSWRGSTSSRCLWPAASSGEVPLEETDSWIAQRLRVRLLAWEEPLDSYLFDTS